MDPPQKIDYCAKHNLPIESYNYKLKVGFCKVCFLSQPGIISAEQCDINLEKIYKQANKEIELVNETYSQFLQQAKSVQVKKKGNTFLDQIIQKVNEEIKFGQEAKKQISNIFQSQTNKPSRIQEIEKTLSNYQNHNIQKKNDLINQLLDFQAAFSEVNQFVELLMKSQNK